MRVTRGGAAAWTAALILGWPAPLAAGSADPPTLAVLRIDTPITLDGSLDEEAWQRAPLATGFVQQDPAVGRPVSERTEVRVLLDESALYFGVSCFDSDPGGVIARELRRDDEL